MSKVIQIIIKVQQKQGDSWKMKNPTIDEAIQNLRDARIHISNAVHDDKSSIYQISQSIDIKVCTHVLGTHSIDKCTSLVQISKYTIKPIQKWLVLYEYSKSGPIKEIIVK